MAHVPVLTSTRLAPLAPADSLPVPSVQAAAEAAGVETSAAVDEPEPPHWPDEVSESAFLADAQERGEVVPKARPTDVPETTDEPQALPALETLVERIPANVRDTLEELFRAKFVKVQRVPKRALKK